MKPIPWLALDFRGMFMHYIGQKTYHHWKNPSNPEPKPQNPAKLIK
jgi:hypothetical protein